MIKLKNTKRFSREERRAQIIGASITLLENGGTKALTTSAISKKVGISEANIYKHFKDKNEIIHFILETISDELINEFNEIINSKISNEEKLKNIFMVRFKFLSKNKGLPRILFSQDLHIGNEDARQKLYEKIELMMEKTREIFKKLPKSKEIDPELFVNMFFGLQHFLTLKFILSGFSISIVKEGEKLWENFEKFIMR